MNLSTDSNSQRDALHAGLQAEEDFIRANSKLFRDPADEDADSHEGHSLQEARSIAKESRDQAGAVPSEDEVERIAQEGCRAPAQSSDSNGWVSGAEVSASGYKATTVCDEEKLWVLDGLDEQDCYIHQSEHKVINEAVEAEEQAEDNVHLDRVDRSDISRLLSNQNLQHTHRVALGWFLKVFKNSKWMHWQGLYPERIAIALLSSWHRGKDVCYCGYKGRFCNEADYCPKCALLLRAGPVVTEYEDLFKKLLPDGRKRYFYAITLSYDWNPDRAGLHYVYEKRNPQNGNRDKLWHDYSFKDQTSIDPLTVENDIGEDNAVTACFRAVFDFAKFVGKVGENWGVLAHRHIAWHFLEYPGLPHHIRPNGHLLIVGDEPITFETGKVMLKTFTSLYHRRQYGGVLYTDMHISPLMSQPEIERWIYYIFEPMNYAGPYKEAVRRGVSVEALNHEVDDRVFQGGNSILSVPSPMRYGVLNVNSGKERYLGAKSVTQQRKEAEAARKAAKEMRKHGTSAPRQRDRYIERQARHEQFLRDEGSY